MKRFSILSIVGLLTLSLQSCFFSEDDIFEESSNQRIESALSEYQTLLTGASNGWKLEYYPGGENHDRRGCTPTPFRRRERNYNVRQIGKRNGRP